MLLLPDMDEAAAVEYAEGIRRMVQDLAIPHAGDTGHGAVVTVSTLVHQSPDGLIEVG